MKSRTRKLIRLILVILLLSTSIIIQWLVNLNKEVSLQFILKKKKSSFSTLFLVGLGIFMDVMIPVGRWKIIQICLIRNRTCRTNISWLCCFPSVIQWWIWLFPLITCYNCPDLRCLFSSYLCLKCRFCLLSYRYMSWREMLDVSTLNFAKIVMGINRFCPLCEMRVGIFGSNSS